MLENGVYTEFTVIESRFEGKDLAAVQDLQAVKKTIVKGAVRDNLQAQLTTRPVLPNLPTVLGSNVSISSLGSTAIRFAPICDLPHSQIADA